MDPLTLLFSAAAGSLGQSLFSGGGRDEQSSSGWTKSPGTTEVTAQRKLDEEAVTSLIRSMLEDQSLGLANTATRGKAPGMYNATTQNLLVDNLLSRIAMDVAKESAPLVSTTKLSDWVTTQSQQMEGEKSSGGGIIGSLLGGCYITTACCKLYDKPDDCHELQTMRKFRDEFVRVKYPEAVTDYYATAPGIVAAIEAREDADEIWAHFYNDYLLPIIELVEAGDYEEAYVGYTDMVIEAEELANG